MNLGEIARMRLHFLTFLLAALALLAVPQAAFAAAAGATDSVAADAAPAAAAEAAEPAGGDAAAAAPAYTPLGPEMIKGQPTANAIDVQEQYSPIGKRAHSFHVLLVWIMGIVAAFVLVLLLYVMIRFNKRANPVPSKTSHNTLLEVLWTGIPVLILVAIAVPSIGLLAEQYESPGEDALTVKANGYQWYWGYEYPDNGGFEVISNMMPDEEAVAKGFPPQLEVDNRMVVPVGREIRLQTFGKDVIHSFAVPSLWFKLDAVPGRINEGKFTIEEPGIYYGQCSELCGVRHGYMPIAIEAVPQEQFDAWVLAQGGTVGGEEAAAPEAAPAEAAPAAAEPEAAPAEATAE